MSSIASRLTTLPEQIVNIVLGDTRSPEEYEEQSSTRKIRISCREEQEVERAPAT